MSTLPSILFQCPAGHQQYAPYRTAQTTWCQSCGKNVLCAPAPPTAAVLHASPRDDGIAVAGKIEALQATWERNRAGLVTHLEPNPKTEAEQETVQALQTGGFPDKHIAALPHMDADGLKHARTVMDIFQGPGPSIVILWGDYGRGKTQVAAAVAKLRYARGQRTRYATGLAITRAIKDNFGSKVPEAELLRRYHECPGLVIDDVHAALDSEPDRQAWARTQIQGIVDTRYSSRRPLKTILICNADSVEVLTARLGGHIISRAQECGKVLRLNRTNYRAPGRQSPPPTKTTEPNPATQHMSASQETLEHPSCAVEPCPIMFDFGAHLLRQREWSERTFGPGSRAKGVCDHIRKELTEIEGAPDDLAPPDKAIEHDRSKDQPAP